MVAPGCDPHKSQADAAKKKQAKEALERARLKLAESSGRMQHAIEEAKDLRAEAAKVLDMQPSPARQTFGDVAQLATVRMQLDKASSADAPGAGAAADHGAASAATAAPAPSAAPAACASCVKLESSLVDTQRAVVRAEGRAFPAFLSGSAFGGLVVLLLMRNRIPALQKLSQNRQLEMVGAAGFILATLLLSVFTGRKRR